MSAIRSLVTVVVLLKSSHRLALTLSLLLALAACTSVPAPTATPRAAPTAAPIPSPTRACGADTIVRDDTDTLEARIPCRAVAGEARFSVIECWWSQAPATLASLSSPYSLEPLTWYPVSAIDGIQPFRFMEPISVTISYAVPAAPHVDPAGVGLYYSRDGYGAWELLPTAVDPSARRATGLTRDVGCFQLRAPWRCPADGREPDDDMWLARQAGELRANAAPLRALFDTAHDEDWFMLWAVTGVTYTVETRDLGPGVDTVLSVLNKDMEPVAVEDNAGGGAAPLYWHAAYDGAHYIRVKPAPGSAFGCEATYSLALTAPPANLTLFYDGLVEYESPAGWITLTRPCAVLDPGFYHFRFDGKVVVYRVRSGVQKERVAIIRLVDSAGEGLLSGPPAYREDEWVEPFVFAEAASAWACVVPEERTELAARVSHGGVTAQRDQDIAANPAIVFQTGKVHSTSGRCTHYLAAGEWRPFDNDMELLPQAYVFRFDDGTPATEYTVVEGEVIEIH